MSLINQIMNAVRMLSNPKQAIDLMLSKMPKEQANILREMMNSKSPQQAISEMAQQGRININQLEEAKNYYNLARKFGIKIKIPNEVWQEAESAIKSNNQNNPRSNGGFRF